MALACASGEASAYAHTAADRAAWTALFRAFFETARDGAPTRADVYPTVAETRAIFLGSATARGAPNAGDDAATRHLAAVERDARSLQAVFRGGEFVGLTGAMWTRGQVELRRCGRLAQPTSQCADGPVVEYRVGAEVRRFRVDALVRLGTRWRIFDPRM